jgi:hypothetical protein
LFGPVAVKLALIKAPVVAWYLPTQRKQLEHPPTDAAGGPSHDNLKDIVQAIVIKPLHTESQRAPKLVSSRQHPDTSIAKHHENLLKVARQAQLRIDVAICL